MEKIFYQSSMPRAGSTVFQQIVGQNPDFYVTPTSGLISMVNASQNAYNMSPEFKAVDRDITSRPFLDFIKGGMNAYCSSITDKPYILDKSRGWGIKFNFLNNVFGEEPKIVCVVRDLRDIISDMERKYQMAMVKPESGTTQYKRTVNWLNNVPVGPALDWTLDIIQTGIKNNILFIRYEDLLMEPDAQMKKFYEYIGLPYFQHDFNNIKQITHENDEIHGIFGDHKIIEGKLAKYESQFQKNLAPESIKYIEDNYAWYFDFFNYLYTTKEK